MVTALSAAAGKRAENVSDAATDDACRADHPTHAAVKLCRHGRDHIEIKIVPRIDRSRANEITHCRHDGIKRIEAQSVLRHAKVGGQLLDIQIVAGFESAESRDCLHLCAQIESSQLRAIKADVPCGDEVVRRARDIQVRRDRARRETGAVGT